MAHTHWCTGQEPASSTRNIEAAEAARGPISHSGCVPTAAEHRYPRFPAKTKRPQRVLRRPAPTASVRTDQVRLQLAATGLPPLSHHRVAGDACLIGASATTRLARGDVAAGLGATVDADCLDALYSYCWPSRRASRSFDVKHDLEPSEASRAPATTSPSE